MADTLITNFLADKGEAFDKWTTLAGKAQRIGLIGGNSISVDPSTRLFYFSSDGFLLIKYLLGNPVETTLSGDVPQGYVKISINGKYYLIGEVATGKQNATYGTFHTEICYSDIVGIYNESRNINLISKE